MRDESWVADPIVWWPSSIVGLQAVIEDLQRLNPRVGLRREVAVGDHLAGAEFLVLDERPAKPLQIAMPMPLGDDLLIGLTDHNYESWPVRFGDGLARQSGPWRMERSDRGALVLRPKSWLEGGVLSAFSIARSGAHSMVIFTGRWGFVPDSHSQNVWEVDSAHANEETWQRISMLHRETHSETASWRIPPDFGINVFSEGDYSREVHLKRARAIVAAGAKVVAVCDLVAGDINLVRGDGIERLERPERWRIEEIPGVEMPFARLLV